MTSLPTDPKPHYEKDIKISAKFSESDFEKVVKEATKIIEEGQQLRYEEKTKENDCRC